MQKSIAQKDLQVPDKTANTAALTSPDLKVGAFRADSVNKDNVGESRYALLPSFARTASLCRP